MDARGSLAPARHVGTGFASSGGLSDIVLGSILLATSVASAWQASTLSIGTAERLGPGLLPLALTSALVVLALALLARGHITGRTGHRRLGFAAFAGIIVLSAVFLVPARAWKSLFAQLYLVTGWPDPVWIISFDGPIGVSLGPSGLGQYLAPSDLAALTLLQSTVAVAVAVRSRLAGFAMLLLGMLLATVGTDVSTDTVRLTFGVAALTEDIPAAVLALGLLAGGSGLVGLAAPARLWTKGRLQPEAADRIAGSLALHLMRAAAAAVLLGSLHLATGGFSDTAAMVVFAVAAVFGMAAILLRWNRWLLLLGLFSSVPFEVYVRRSLLLSRGDLAIFWSRPISALLLGVSIALVAWLIAGAVRGSGAARD